MGSVVQGNYAYRTLYLIHCPSLRILTESSDLWTHARTRAVYIVLGVAELRVKNRVTTISLARWKSGYQRMLQEFVSGTVSRENVKRINFVGDRLKTRAWGPYEGVQRRGREVLRDVQEKARLKPEHLDVLLDRIHFSFIEFIDRSRAPSGD